MTLTLVTSNEIPHDNQYYKLQRIENAVEPVEPFAVVTKLPVVESNWYDRT